MSHHSEEGFAASSDSFWEPGNYKRTTKRIEDGHNLCNELMTLVKERAEIEKNYSKSLKGWAIRWNNIIEKGPEYGTTEAAWKGALIEADRRCELHNKVKEDLNLKVNNQLKQWQKENYHKSVLQLKEKKELEEQFKKAQKPWAKLLNKVNKSKTDYHNACKAERTAVNQERNASGDSTLSQDQLKKLQDRVLKAKDQVSKTRESYESCLLDLNNYNAKYMEDMTDVFERCQRMEAQRLQCFKEILFSLQSCLNIAEDPNLAKIYEEFFHTINNADHEKDLRWWSNTHGINMAMNWPQFEEYTEEFREIAGTKTKKIGGLGDGNITLIHQRSVGDELPERKNRLEYIAKNESKPVRSLNSDPEGRKHEQSSVNPFDDEEWDEFNGGSRLSDNGEPGIKVKALYDYEAAEEDELEFKTGDVFEKLEDEDEQGWCKGRKDGKVGLYPANYIEVL